MSARQVCAAKCGRWSIGGAPSLSLIPSTILLGLVAGCTANVSSVSPTSVAAAGPAFKMTVLGSGFTSGSTVQWNGTNRTTTYVSAKELLAQINAADIATTGSASITVTNPGSIGGTGGSSGTSSDSGASSAVSNSKTISIVAPSVDATAYQIDPLHDGAMTFSSVSFPSSPAWRVNLAAGTPSNIVIADKRVFLTLGTSSGSELLALNQSNGTTAWSPAAITGVTAGSAGVAYDAGRVFVAEADAGGSTLYAYDAASGELDWSTALGAGPPGAPTAADGSVYVIAAGTILYALDDAKGAITWQQPLSASGGTPAVTADGVYVTSTTSACSAIDLRPATGEVIWSSSGSAGSCPQAAAATPAVANQLVYAPTSSGTAVFSAEAGTNAGALSDSLPAAFTSNTAYFASGPNLDAVTLSNDGIQWTFNGDNQLDTSPIVVNKYVISGSSLGNLYAVDTTSGNSVWTQSLGAKIQQLAVGDGLLLVVAEGSNTSGGTLTAYTIAASP